MQSQTGVNLIFIYRNIRPSSRDPPLPVIAKLQEGSVSKNVFGVKKQNKGEGSKQVEIVVHDRTQPQWEPTRGKMWPLYLPGFPKW